MKKKRRLKKWVIIVLIIICLSGVIYSSYNILNWKKSINKNDEIKEKIDEFINIKEDAINEEEKYKIDFKTLKEQNPDIVAYLKVNNTNIAYTVVKGIDNSYYLTHNFNKEYNVIGWIFADYKNKFDGTDKNIVIFGHNIKDGSMFGTLKNALNKEWQENKDNLQITLVTEKDVSLYQIFSTYSIEPEDYYINTEFKNDEEFTNFLKKIKARSNYDYSVDIDTNDTILTLSTCTANGTKRVAVHAKKISDKINN